MIKKYMVLLQAQYTPTKLFNYLTQFGNPPQTPQFCTVTPPIILSYPFDVC